MAFKKQHTHQFQPQAVVLIVLFSTGHQCRQDNQGIIKTSP